MYVHTNKQNKPYSIYKILSISNLQNMCLDYSSGKSVLKILEAPFKSVDCIKL